ncbi:LPD5 domain-containing protein [Shewanella sp. D64]|uniref:LPD38 domain-containing protein n=1 Tax=unclassified Shewanella TaxID=196818 RepID=UPI0022BA1D70|nr:MULTISPECIES: LPD38 domain-containing protein [unclassified Shewanella]MEC4724249.1 LPD5 domain-containing protein [Shewanella sp. D64]MEC4738761.1 LPD5 domain-containing protein [Shewanella sp. E94]WBJ97799.1 LPD5 domain-containing protein [Shewanella sp. MTB7]
MPSKLIDPFSEEEFEYIDPFEEAEVESNGGVTAAFGAGVDKVQELGYRAVKGFTDVGAEKAEQTNIIGRTIGQDGSLSKWAQSGVEENIAEASTYQPTVKSYKDIDSLDDFGSYAGELIAGSVPYMAAAVTPIGAGTLAGGLSEEAYDGQPTDDKNAVRAVASGVGQMVLERLGIKGALGQVGRDVLKNGVLATAKKIGQGGLVKAAKDPKTAALFGRQILKGALWEGATEAGQEALAQWGAGASLDEIHSLDEAFIGGLTVGGIIRTSSEGAQRVMAWQKKSSDVAKNGIQALVEQGVMQDDAIEQVRNQMIESGIKQGLSEAESAAAAGRTMKVEFGIEHEIFAPIAQDVASRRAEMHERLNQQRIDAGIGAAQQALAGEGALSAEQLIQTQMNEGRIVDPFDDVAEANVEPITLKDSVEGENAVDASANKSPPVIDDPIKQLQLPLTPTPSTEGVLDSEAKQIDEASNQAALSPENNLPEPSQAQKEAGNYKMGHVKVNGMAVSIENPKGSQRSGVDSDGKDWSVTMKQHYGYIKGTEGADGDHVDVFIGDSPQVDSVYIVDQIEPKSGKFDEHKVMIGFESELEAKDGYLSNYADGWKGIGAITKMPVDEFKQWVKTQATKKPFVYKVPINLAPKEEVKVEADETLMINEESNTAAVIETDNERSSTPVAPKSAKIEDFGEVLLGAAKHTYSFNESLGAEVDTETAPLSKSFPQPDYQKLTDEGADPVALALVAQLRGEIKTKPKKYGKGGWASQVDSSRAFSVKLLSGEHSVDDVAKKMWAHDQNVYGRQYIKHLPDVIAIAKDIPASSIKSLGNYKLNEAHYSLFHGEKDVDKWVVTNTKQGGGLGGMGNQAHFDTKQEALTFIKEQVTDTSTVNDKKLAKFDIWTERGKSGVVFLGKKLAANKYIELKRFDKGSEARAYRVDNNVELVELLKQKRQVGAMRRPDNNPRVGEEHRKGKDATPDLFSNTFGFRGVQFGNWVEGGKRQNDLNYAFDGLMDLASVINVPPKALSLNGQLGLAFGARGKGGKNSAAAHYEPNSVVINLTKKQGSGSLAHEWFHALDNYFAKMDNESVGEQSSLYLTDSSRQAGLLKEGRYQRSSSDDFGVRPEVFDAFKRVTSTIKKETDLVNRSAQRDKFRAKNYWGTVVEMTARSFERYVIGKLAQQGYESDYLANIVNESSTAAMDEMSDYPYPLAVEMDVVNKAYDGLFDTLKTKETDKGVALFRKDASTVFNKGKLKPKGIPLSEAKAIAQEFVDSYNGNIKLEFKVRQTQEELYGPEATIEKYGRIKGSYNGKGKSVLGLVSGNLHSSADARETLRHEILGHYGLATFSQIDKKAILDKIIDAQSEPTLKVQWDKIKADSYYSKLDINQQAEEVFAHTVENYRNGLQRLYDTIIAWLKGSLRKVGLNKYPSSSQELHRLAATIAKQIRSGDRGGPIDSNNQTMHRRESAGHSLPDENLKAYFIRNVQDKFYRLKLAQRDLDVNDSNNAYMAEEAFHGKIGEDLRKLELEHTDKIAKTMAEHSLSQDEVDLYLIAKHAKERNAYIDTINPELGGAGSGMNNDQAQAILDKAVLESKRLALESVANEVYSMLEKSRVNIVNFGLEQQDAIDTWKSQYQYYVPLKGYAAEDGTHTSKSKKFGTGKGFNIRGRETIKAMGRRSLAESPLLHTIEDTTQAVIRARKNEVGQTFLRLVESNPDPELWQIYTANDPDYRRGEVSQDGEKVIGQVKMTAFEMGNAKDKYFTTKVDGVEHFIKLKDPLLLQAMGNLGVDQSNLLTRTLGVATRTLSALVTTWNPEFMATNFARDIQAAIYNVVAETQVNDGKALNTEKLALKMIKSTPRAMAVLRQGFRNNKFDGSARFSNPKWGRYLKEFLESGAKTGWVNQKDIQGLANELKGTISRASNTKQGKVRRMGKQVADFVSDYNDVVENATRFSVYYHAREQGISVKQASSLAKNLTINFNRKGEVSNTVNALFMFANASVQGTANMLRAVATPKDRSKSLWDPQFYNLSQKMAIGTIGTTVVMANLMREIGGDDEDGTPFYDKVPDHVKATNFVIMLGGMDYVAIPMPYGYNLFANIGHSIDGVIQGKSIGKLATGLVLSAAGTFSPIGFTPTVATPFVEVDRNKNFFGGNIYPEQHGFGAKKSDSHLGTNYTWEWTKELTIWLNEVTGGSKFRSGMADFTPQSIEHLAKFMGGGVLQFGLRWQNLAVKAMEGKEIESRDIPFARRFYKRLNPKAAIGEFYTAKDTLAKVKADYLSLHGKDKVEFKREYKLSLELQKFASNIEKSLRNLNKQKGSIEASRLSSLEKERRIQLIEDKKIELTLRFSKKRNELGLQEL